MNYIFIKRIIDILLSILLILLLFPISVIILLINFAILKRNPIFIQTRSGIHGSKISIIKIRTLIDNQSLDLNNRAYSFGNFLRKFKFNYHYYYFPQGQKTPNLLSNFYLNTKAVQYLFLIAGI